MHWVRDFHLVGPVSPVRPRPRSRLSSPGSGRSWRSLFVVDSPYQSVEELPHTARQGMSGLLISREIWSRWGRHSCLPEYFNRLLLLGDRHRHGGGGGGRGFNFNRSRSAGDPAGHADGRGNLPREQLRRGVRRRRSALRNDQLRASRIGIADFFILSPSPVGLLFVFAASRPILCFSSRSTIGSRWGPRPSPCRQPPSRPAPRRRSCRWESPSRR